MGSLDKARRAVGRRGACLLLIGAVWLAIALDQATSPATAPVRAALPLDLVPVPLRVLLWAVPALAAWSAAFRRGAGRDAYGWVVLVIPALARALSSGYGFVVWLVTAGQFGYGRGLLGAGVWSAVIALLIVLAGWRDQPHERRKRR